MKNFISNTKDQIKKDQRDELAKEGLDMTLPASTEADMKSLAAKSKKSHRSGKSSKKRDSMQ